MRAGIFVAYWPWFRPEEQVEPAVLADALGLDAVWVAEAWGQDVELMTRAGHGAAARAVQDAWLGGDRLGAARALTDELVDAVGPACTSAGLDDGLAAFEAAGVTTLVAVACGPDRPAIVRTLAAATAGAATVTAEGHA